MSVMCQLWALDRGERHSRFTVGHPPYVPDYQLLVKKEGIRRPYVGYCHADHHPFHCWSVIPVLGINHFLGENPRFIKNPQKTLEWSTIIAETLKLTVLRIRVYSQGGLFPE